MAGVGLLGEAIQAPADHLDSALDLAEELGHAMSFLTERLRNVKKAEELAEAVREHHESRHLDEPFSICTHAICRLAGGLLN